MKVEIEELDNYRAWDRTGYKIGLEWFCSGCKNRWVGDRAHSLCREEDGKPSVKLKCVMLHATWKEV